MALTTTGHQPGGMKPLVVVTCATSRLGFYTAQHLLRWGRVDVRALVRSARHPRAVELARRGAELVDLGERTSGLVARAVADASCICCVHRAEPGEDFDAAAHRAAKIALAAKSVEPPHFVYVSEAAAEQPSELSHVESRRHLEQTVQEIGLRTTILRPAPSYELFATWWGARPFVVGAMRATLGSHRAVPLVAEADVGWFAARASETPARSSGVTLEIAGDSLTLAEIAAVHQRATGERLRGVRVPAWLVESLSVDLAATLGWARSHNFAADIPRLRRQHPGMLTLEGWFRRRADRTDGAPVQLAL